MHRKEAAAHASARAQATQPLSAAQAELDAQMSVSADGRPAISTPAELIYSGDSSFLMQGLY